VRDGFHTAVVLCVVLVPLITAAQDVDPKLTFEVASVRPNELGAQSFLLAFRNGRFTARYHTVKALIRSAYRLTESQLFGAPAWLDADRFDVLATAPRTPDSARGTIPPVVLTMLRNLLEERFQLKARLETREYPLFALVLARPDGSLGPGLRRTTVPCAPRAVGELGELFGPLPSTRTQCGGRADRGVLLSTGGTIADWSGRCLGRNWSRASDDSSSIVPDSPARSTSICDGRPTMRSQIVIRVRHRHRLSTATSRRSSRHFRNNSG
jgi:hypothetical protein